MRLLQWYGAFSDLSLSLLAGWARGISLPAGTRERANAAGGGKE